MEPFYRVQEAARSSPTEEGHQEEGGECAEEVGRAYGPEEERQEVRWEEGLAIGP